MSTLHGVRTALHTRTVAISAGVGLVLVPTLFSVFPEWTGWDAGVRVLVLVAWMAAAVVVVLGTARQSERVEDLVRSAIDRRDQARTVAGRVLQAGASGIPGHYEFRLFLPERDGPGLILRAEYESPGSDPSEGWRPGVGATGTAWERRSYVRVRGKAVADGTYGLAPAQQERYQNLAVVAAAPILNARLDRIGVLSISGTTDDGFFFTDEGCSATSSWLKSSRVSSSMCCEFRATDRYPVSRDLSCSPGSVRPWEGMQMRDRDPQEHNGGQPREDAVVTPVTERDVDDALDRLAERDSDLFRSDGPLAPAAPARD